MAYQIASEVVLGFHFLYILFVVFGGPLVLWRPRLLWLHVPLVIWGALVSVVSWTCPLTHLENWFRAAAGGSGYEGTFIEEYLSPLVYPGITIGNFGLAVGLSLLVWNAGIYVWLWRRRSGRRSAV